MGEAAGHDDGVDALHRGVAVPKQFAGGADASDSLHNVELAVGPRELDDADLAHCPGYGDWTATGPAGSAPPCSGGSAICQPGEATGCAKIDLAFVREDDIAGPYSADATAIPATCPEVPEKPGVYSAGSCSDHRVLTGTIVVRVGVGAPGAASSR